MIVRFTTWAFTWVCTWVLVFTSLACWSVGVLSGSPLKFRSLDNQSLESIGEVRAVAQDHDGFMWFGGEAGLARYDGYQVKLYLHDADDDDTISTNSINDLLVDKHGFLWVATYWGLNRYDPRTERFKRYQYNPEQTRSLSHNSVICMLESKVDGAIWAGTAGGGLNRLDPVSDDFDRIRHQPGVNNSLSGDEVLSVYEDSTGKIWAGLSSHVLDRLTVSYTGGKVLVERYDNYKQDFLKSVEANAVHIRSIAGTSIGDVFFATDNGLFRLGGDAQKITHFPWDLNGINMMRTRDLRDVYVDALGQVWIAAGDSGVYRFLSERDGFEWHLLAQDGSTFLIANRIFSDKDGALWVGHAPSGASRVDRYASTFQNYQRVPGEENDLTNSDVLSIAEDGKSNLWVGTRNGLNYIDRSSGKIQQYHFRRNDPRALNSAAVSALLVDDERYVWSGSTWWGLSKLDLQTGIFQRYMPDPSKDNSLTNREVWSLFKDRDGELWVGTNKGGLHRYRRDTDDFMSWRIDPGRPNPGRIIGMHEDDIGVIWLATDDGLYSAHRNDAGGTAGLTIRAYPQHTSHPIDLSVPTVRAISQDLDGYMWFATQGGGVNRWGRDDKSFRVFQVPEGLPHNTVNGVVEDDFGSLWFSTGNGLSRFDKEREQFYNYSKLHGLPGNLFHDGASLKTQKGELVFGSSHGLTVFRPDKVFKNTVAPSLVLTDFKIFNKAMPFGHPDSPLSKALNHTWSITLNHTQSVFSFEFAALNYDLPEKSQYAYYLKGFEDDWNYIKYRRSATYTNLDPGEYVLRIKASNNEGVWNERGLSIAIKILPPWWLTWYVKLVYVFLGIVVLLLIFYTVLHLKRVEDESQIIARLRDLDKTKDAFLANTSHELRTPLNGIIGLSESLIAGVTGQLPKETLDNLRLIVNSSKRLAYLIDDILDFSKLREHSITLNRTVVDIHQLTESILQLSGPMVGTKTIELVNSVDKYLPSVLADENRVQQILYNLVGNAIKFTNEGCVRVSTQMEGDLLWILVEDTGIGIAEDKLDSVFNAFEQVDGSGSRKFGGTGLGLAVTRQLVELHGGVLKISSKENWGTTLRFSLTQSDTAAVAGIAVASERDLSAIETVRLGGKPLLRNDGGVDAHGELQLSSENPDGQYHILVVDDEPINRQVLFNLLSLEDYRISECSSGQQALQMLKQETHGVDLVMLDVMMPGLTGYQVCQMLRKDYSTGQLPIIFLTAKTQVSDMEEGFRVGGNDFLTKPVAKEELFSRIKTHLRLLDMHRRIENEVTTRTEQLRRSHDHLNKAYENLKQTQSQLVQAEKMSSLGALVAGVGHEINNPASFANAAASNLDRDLSSFQFYLRELVADEPGNDEILESFEQRFEQLFSHLSLLSEGTQRINEIVNNLRTFSRSDSGDLSFETLSKGLSSTLELVRANFKTEVKFTLDIKEDTEILCAASEINQVFMNLMANACQAMCSTGNPDDNGYYGVLQITMEQVGEDLCISFQDNGCGMTPETVERIFEPFFTTKPEGEGTGLGMSISYGIVDRHKGRFEVSSTLGEGTLICIFLPI